MYAIKVIIKYLFFTFLFIQLIQVDITNPKTDKSLEIQAPKPIMDIFHRACYDCHSNSVKIPWYSKIAPMSWEISRHINVGRQWLNFSVWNSYTPEQKDKKLEEIYKAVHISMPLRDYVWIHHDAELSKEDRELVRQWTGKAPF